MITEIKCYKIEQGKFRITYKYQGSLNDITVGDYEIRNEIVNKLVDAQIKPNPKIIREIKYIRAQR